MGFKRYCCLEWEHRSQRTFAREGDTVHSWHVIKEDMNI